MHAAPSKWPPLGLGLASVVLGAIGLMLFVLPILAIPISACGLAAGVIGMVAAAFWSSIDGRLALAGAVLCLLAMIVEFALAQAPSGNWGQPSDPSTATPLLPRSYIAPPAPFHGRFSHPANRFAA
jgi:hypothetical protein